MSHRYRDGLRTIIQALLFLAVIATALWQFRQRTAPQPVRFELAAAMLRDGKIDDARKDFDKAIRLHPGDLPTYLGVLDTCMHANKTDLAIEYGKRAVDDCKQSPKEQIAALWCVIAGQYSSLQKPPNQKDAIACAAKAMELTPTDPNVMNTYGYLLADNATGPGPDVDKALSLLKAALASIKENAGSMADQSSAKEMEAMTEDSYGWALYKNAQYGDAITALSQALYDYPGGSNDGPKASYYHLGMAYFKNNQIEQARNAFKNALFTDPNYEDAKLGLGQLPPEEKKPDNKPTSPAVPPVAPKADPGPGRISV